jgi:hypothetical protein
MPDKKKDAGMYRKLIINLLLDRADRQAKRISIAPTSDHGWIIRLNDRIIQKNSWELAVKAISRFLK